LILVLSLIGVSDDLEPVEVIPIGSKRMIYSSSKPVISNSLRCMAKCINRMIKSLNKLIDNLKG